MKNDKLVFYLLLLAPFFAFPQAKNKIFKHRSAFELNETAIMLFQLQSGFNKKINRIA